MNEPKYKIGDRFHKTKGDNIKFIQILSISDRLGCSEGSANLSNSRQSYWYFLEQHHINGNISFSAIYEEYLDKYCVLI